MENELSWEQKLSALQVLGDTALRMRKPGNWYVDSHTEVGGDGFLSGKYGNGATPQLAVLDHWRQLVDELDPKLYVVARPGGVEAGYRWSGFMWIVVKDRVVKENVTHGD